MFCEIDSLEHVTWDDIISLQSTNMAMEIRFSKRKYIQRSMFNCYVCLPGV